ncbi:phage tail protein [Parasphingorhabdus cellanae]|uniref:Phage tail protein n=1 Tax=Parasphingorhabdus cellanae TaxID=2806553 RepID=A0ABX7TAQ4_9SPHN|nr:phage tail protein [Parasphingorhabdus cellanae]QTD57552.1 phage tail protein [Parasphingorhabdus cellanae]
MATLVLTAVGTALGGPIGGALGGLLGRQFDQNVLFKPKGVEGPRLQELAVQTSSYGSQIPRIFGRMRVAGTVIWATDLKETRERRGGGKGRPKSTIYSYSACFAVALSSRTIKNIGRIWADGKIFRGSAGDFKTETGFRFYRGQEDQAVDGLIASAEAASGTPAYRGLALAVFEDMDLTDYGNRIPSLTFEVIADDGTVSLAVIIDDVSGQKISASVDEPLHGFAAGGQNRREVLDAIGDNFSLSFQMTSFRSWPSHMMEAAARDLDPDAVILPIGDNILSRQNGQPVDRAESRILPETKLPRQYTLRYYDPARDYQSGLQNAFRPGMSRVVLDRDFPAAISAAQAKNIAQTKLWSLYQERVTAQAHIARTGEPVMPGTFVRTDDGDDIWLVRNCELNHGSIALGLSKATSSLVTADRPTDNGRPVKEMDALAGVTRLALIDLPFALDAPIQVSDVPRLYAAAAGDIGWRNAQLFATGPNGSNTDLIGQIAAPAIIGTAPAPIGPSGAHIIDRKNRLVVQMHNRNMVLNDADRAQLSAGYNIAAIGAEIFQFGFAKPIGDGRFLLSYFLRGLGGTEKEMDRHSAGENFVLLDGSSLTEIDPRHYVPSQPAGIAAIGRGDEEAVSQVIDDPGRALKPWSPVHPRFAFNRLDDLEISWTRRSRAGLAWPDNIETPLAEETEQYRITIGSNAPVEQAQPSVVIPADQVQDYRDTGAAMLPIKVQQVGRHDISDPLSFTVKI